MGKKILLIFGIIAGALIALVLCVFIYVELGLYKPATSDAELLGYYFSPDEPGFSNVEIIKSEGEGIRRIPRTLEFSVQMESYPQPVTCQGEIFFDMGDPMIVMCAGAHFSAPASIDTSSWLK